MGIEESTGVAPSTGEFSRTMAPTPPSLEGRKKILIVGVDHGIGEEFFNNNIEDMWSDRFFMYNESFDPGTEYTKRHVDGITENELLGQLELIMTGVVAVTNKNMGTIISKMARHGYRREEMEGLSQHGVITMFLIDLGWTFNQYIDDLYAFEGEHSLEHCGSDRLAAIYWPFDHEEHAQTKRELYTYDDEKMRRTYNYYLHRALMGSMIVIETLSTSGTELGQKIQKIFGGVDFTRVGTDAPSFTISIASNELQKDIRDNDVINRILKVMRGPMKDKYDAFVLVVGSGHVESLYDLLTVLGDEIMLLTETFMQEDVSDLANASLEEIMTSTMNNIRSYLQGKRVRRSTRIARAKRPRLVKTDLADAFRIL